MSEKMEMIQETFDGVGKKCYGKKDISRFSWPFKILYCQSRLKSQHAKFKPNQSGLCKVELKVLLQL